MVDYKGGDSLEEKARKNELPVLMGRRTFLDYCIGGGIAAWAALTAYTALAFLWPTKSSIGQEGSEGITIALSEVPIGDAKKISYQGKPAIIIHTQEGVFALSAICTHLGCLVNWHPGENQIECPCHAARFDLRGNVLGGPAPGPLESYKAEIISDQIKIG